MAVELAEPVEMAQFFCLSLINSLLRLRTFRIRETEYTTLFFFRKHHKWQMDGEFAAAGVIVSVYLSVPVSAVLSVLFGLVVNKRLGFFFSFLLFFCFGDGG